MRLKQLTLITKDLRFKIVQQNHRNFLLVKFVCILKEIVFYNFEENMYKSGHDILQNLLVYS